VDIEAAVAALAGASTDEERIAILQEVSAYLDPADAYTFELAATRIAVEAPQTCSSALRSAADPGGKPAFRFLCVAVGAIACRRLNQHKEGHKLFDDVGRDFDHIPLMWHLRSLSYSGGSLTELRQGLDAARSALERLPQSPGVIHNVAVFLMDVEEAEGETGGHLEEALAYVERAIRLERRSRFLYTRARILRRLKRYEEARENLVEAVQAEDRNAADYQKRVLDYTLEMSLLDVGRTLERVIDQTESTLGRQIEETVTRKVEGAELRLVQTIAFVAAAIGFVQASVAAIGGRSIGETVVVLGVLAAALFGAVGLAAVLIKRSRP
jgi:tetratricopeptide (TPR) repeat protein